MTITRTIQALSCASFLWLLTACGEGQRTPGNAGQINAEAQQGLNTAALDRLLDSYSNRKTYLLSLI